MRSLVPIATCAQATAQQIAWGAIGRRAIRLDPKWRGGDYYDAEPGEGPHEGLALARMVAQVTFRTDDVFTDRFGRELADGATAHDGFALWQRFEVERYLDHHGDKLVAAVRRQQLPAPSARRWTSTTSAAGGAASKRRWPASRCRRCIIGIWSDLLYPTYQQQQIRDVLRRQRHAGEYVEIDSPHGHDAFLIDLDQVGAAVADFLDGRREG